jgi:hypothetical protein
MADGIRIMGLLAAALGLGALIVFALAEKGTTAFQPPARYWGIATGMVVEISGIIARFSLWGQPFNPRDIVFLTINLLIFTTCVVSLKQGGPANYPKKEAP